MIHPRKMLLMLLPLAFVACEAEEEIDTEFGSETEAIAPETMPVEEPAASMGAIQMQPLGDATVNGTATVNAAGTGTEVTVQLTGLTQGEHPGHIHQGTCASPGSVVTPLQPITAGADGTGSMTTTVELDPTTVRDGQHIILYHPVGGGPPIVCGEIPQHAM